MKAKRKNLKPKSDSRAEALTVPQQTALLKWVAIENISISSAAERLKQEFGRDVGQAALTRFYQLRAPRVRELLHEEIARTAIAQATDGAPVR